VIVVSDTAASSTTFDAMGSPVHVVVVGPSRLSEVARRRVEDLEQKWSRFRPTSEISRLNEAGAAMASPDTVLLVQRAVQGWAATEGRFDPTVHDALVAQGYDRPFATGLDRDADRPAAAVPGCWGIVVDEAIGAVVLPPGVHLDPGGIGKGLAADLVVADLIAAGAEGAMVSIGGDLRAEGRPPEGDGWTIALDEPAVGGAVGTIAFAAGAVATSSTRVQRWSTGEREVHHLIDPATGMPHRGGAALVTVVAAEGWWAEVATKDLMAKTPGTAPLEETAALVVASDGRVHLVGGMEAYLS
jgi:thiamine biosynthesis lipoprotein